MKESIKKRIEAVRRGEVPEGYCKVHPYVIPNDWKVVKLGNITKRTSRPNKDGQDRPAYSINNRKGFVPQNEQFEEGSYEDLDKSAYKIVRKGEFAYNPARVNVGSIGRLRNAEEVAVSSLYVCVSVDDKVDGEYFDAWTKSLDFYKETVRNTEGSVREYLFYENFANMRMPIPSRAEQKKIAEILATCDRVIELTQGKIDELNKLKQTCLRKMFPQKGQAVPEARFPGYSDLWDQRKISELAVFEKGSGYSKEDLKEVGTPIILYGRLYTKYQFEIGEVDTFADIKTGSVFSKGDEVIVPASGETAEDIARAAAIVKPGILLGGDLNILHPFAFMNPSFVALSISNGQPQKELAKKAQGKSVVHVHNSDIQEVTICYPGRDEQDKIVSFFSRLDGLITLHQRELEEYEKYKKALMQLLLTGLVRVNA